MDAVITASGRDIGIDELRGVHIETSGRVAGNAAEVTALTARFAGGSVTGRGRVGIDGTSGTINLRWQRLDLATLMRPHCAVTSDRSRRPCADGSLDADWNAPRLDALRIRTESRLTALPVDSGSASRVPLDGSIALDVERQRLALRAEQTVGSVDDSGTIEPEDRERPEERKGREGRKVIDLGAHATVTVDIASSLDAGDLLRSPLSGAVRVNAPDLGELARLLSRGGILEASSLRGGTARGDFLVAGTFGAPRLDGSVEANDVRYGTLEPAALQTRVSLTPTDIGLDDIQATLGESSVHAQGRLQCRVRKNRWTVRGHAEKSRGARQRRAAARWRVDGALEAKGTMAALSAPQATATIAAKTLNAAGQQIDRLDADLRFIDRTLTIDRLCLEANLCENLANPENHREPADEQLALSAQRARPARSGASNLHGARGSNWPAHSVPCQTVMARSSCRSRRGCPASSTAKARSPTSAGAADWLLLAHAGPKSISVRSTPTSSPPAGASQATFAPRRWRSRQPARSVSIPTARSPCAAAGSRTISPTSRGGSDGRRHFRCPARRPSVSTSRAPAISCSTCASRPISID